MSDHRRQFHSNRYGVVVRCRCGWWSRFASASDPTVAAKEWEAHRDRTRLDDKIRLGAVRVQVNVKEAQASEVFARFERNLREAFRKSD